MQGKFSMKFEIIWMYVSHILAKGCSVLSFLFGGALFILQPKSDFVLAISNQNMVFQTDGLRYILQVLISDQCVVAEVLF